MQRVNHEMMRYIELTGAADRDGIPWQMLDESVMTRAFPMYTDDLGLVRPMDLPRIYWHNLEKISSHIEQDIQESALTDEYNWTNGLSTSVSGADAKRLIYRAARRAGQAGIPSLAQHRHLGVIALESWRERWRLTFDAHGLSLSALKSAAETLLDCYEREAWQEERYWDALNTARVADALTRNGTAARLFAVQLPIIDPDNTDAYCAEAEKAVQAFELMCLYYSLKNWVGSRRPIKLETDLIAFYRQMLDDLHE